MTDWPLKMFQALQSSVQVNLELKELTHYLNLLEKLKQDLANNKFSSAKNNKINRLTGFCSVCRDIPEFFMIYDCGDVQNGTILRSN